MSFQTIFFTLFLFFSSFQGDKKEYSNYSQVIQNKSTDYFSLNKFNRLSFKELTIFHEECITENYKLGEVYTLNTLGTYYRREGKYKKALKYYNEALNICKEHNFIDAQMVSLNLAAVIFRRQEDIKSALDYHQSVISLASKIKIKSHNNKISLSIAENSLGNIYVALKQYKLAIGQFEKAIKTQLDTQNLRGLAINYQNIGQANENLKLYDKALENYAKSLSYNKQIESTIGKVICDNGIASVAIKKGNYKKALTILENIYPIAEKLGNKYYVSRTLSNLGWVQLKLKKYSASLINLNKALEISNTVKVKKLNQIDIFNHLSELYALKGNTKKSYFYYKEAVEEERKTLGQRNYIYISNLISKQELQSQKSALRELQNETKIKSLQLSRNRNILIITLVTIALLSVVLYSIYRQHLLKSDQRLLLLEQQALQTQMNPHFVFNALNSIKLYIINNEQKNAVHYLNKFSKLIRNILEVSKVKEVSLKEELNTMNLYMTIENIRFDNNIEYVENIDPDLNTDTIKIPPLVLQPFLENSIWHGLSSKEGKKRITIEAKEKYKNIVEVTIMDNGIGREAAEKIKKNKSLKRKSVGIELTRQRLITFCNEFTDEFSLKYYDLVDKDKNPVGTIVSLYIPLS